MNTPQQPEDHDVFVLKGYARAWCVGSGLVAVLRPGAHRITSRIKNNGRPEVIINDRYYLSEEELGEVLSADDS
jgi:hypothetical protein